MNKIILSIFLSLASVLSLYSQQTEDQKYEHREPQKEKPQRFDYRDKHRPKLSKEEIDKNKFEFICRKISVSEKQKPEFTKIYNETKTKEEKLLTELKILVRENELNMTDIEVTKKLEKVLKIEDEISKIKTERFKKLEKVFNSRQLMEFYRAERLYIRSLINAKMWNNPFFGTPAHAPEPPMVDIE